MHKFRVNFWWHTGKLINNTGLEFDLQDLCTLIISNRSQDTGLNGLPFQTYHQSLTWVLNG